MRIVGVRSRDDHRLRRVAALGVWLGSVSETPERSEAVLKRQLDDPAPGLIRADLVERLADERNLLARPRTRRGDRAEVRPLFARPDREPEAAVLRDVGAVRQ